MERGQHKSEWVLGNKVHCFLWKDCKLVGFVETFCGDTDQTTVTHKLGDGSRIMVNCPTSVKLYNQYMGGVDLADQLRNTYTCSHKSAHKWYMRLFWLFRNIHYKCIHFDARKSQPCNCSQLNTEKLAHKEFRL